MRLKDVETWKDIRGFEGLYQISSLGRVKSLEKFDSRGRKWEERILKSGINSHGYLVVILYKNGIRKNFKNHRLTAIAFIPNPNNLPEVNHLDENKTNSNVDNLEWCTGKYNMNYGNAKRIAVANTNYVKRSANTDYKRKVANTDYVTIGSKLGKPINQFDRQGVFIGTYPGARQAGRKLGINQSDITQCCKGKKKIAGGFIWKYKEEPQS